MPTLTMFTKLIVSNEEAQAAYYSAVYQLNEVYRAQGASDGEAYREIILSPGVDMAAGTLVMFAFPERPAPRDQQVILGFQTDDLDALVARIEAHGGKLAGPIREETAHGVRVVFSTDPEGALCENVQMLAR
ncbi:MAG: bleomycin resistance protein [Sphingomonadales bacterium]|nr:bleomycin resistance protein [Sphingomonadales bacterium]